KSCFEERIRSLEQLLLLDLAFREDILLQCEEPTIDDGAESTRPCIRRRNALDQAAIDCLHPMQRRLGLGNLYLARSEAATAGPLLQPAREKCLAATVFTTDSLEAAR